jgi:hypothetical protein
MLRQLAGSAVRRLVRHTPGRARGTATLFCTHAPADWSRPELVDTVAPPPFLHRRLIDSVGFE